MAAAGPGSGEVAMGAIIFRSALVAWGRNPAPNLAYVLGEGPGRYRKVTWAEVMEARRKRQVDRLRNIRYVPEWRACRIHVAYFDQDLMGGWQAFITDWRGRGWDTWIDRDARYEMPALMSLFPLVLRLGSEREQWERWKPVFASRYQRREQDGEPVGVATVWRRGNELRQGKATT